MTRAHLRVLALALTCGQAACGGTAATTPGLVAAVAAPVYDVLNGGAFALPAAGGVSGTVTFAAPTTAGTTIVAGAATGTTATASGTRRPAISDAATIFYVVSFTPRSDVTFPTLPSFALTLPPGIATANRAFFYAISDPTAPAGMPTYRTEGPGTVSGSRVTFDASNVPLVLRSGVTTTFAFFSTGVPSADNGIYVGVHGAVDVFATSTTGNAAPMRTLSVQPPPSAPQGEALAHDASGRVFVLTGTTVAIFAAGAGPNDTPVQTITLVLPPGMQLLSNPIGALPAFAVSPAGEIAVAVESNVLPLYGTSRYRSDTAGNALPIGSIPSSTPVSALAYDAANELIVATAGPFRLPAMISTYAPGASNALRAFAVPLEAGDQFATNVGALATNATLGTVDVLVAHETIAGFNPYDYRWDIRRYPQTATTGTPPVLDFPIVDGLALAEDSAGTFYVLDQSAIRVYAAGGDPRGTPARVITGTNTGLASSLNGLTVIP